jgi:hypothetical protein
VEILNFLFHSGNNGLGQVDRSRLSPERERERERESERERERERERDKERYFTK